MNTSPNWHFTRSGHLPLEEPTSVAVFDSIEYEAVCEEPLPADVNPYTDLRFSLILDRIERTPPSHFYRSTATPWPAILRIEGFCDGDDGTLRLRFMPDAPGMFAGTLLIHHGETLLGEQAVTIQATDSMNHGPVWVDPEYPWHFVFEGTGNHFFYNGTTAYFLLGWNEAEFESILDRLAYSGVNRIRVALSGRVESAMAWHEPVYASEKFSFRLNPWQSERPDDLEPGWDVTRFNPAFWFKVDWLVYCARERGIVVSVVFYVDGYRPGVDPFGKENAGGPDEKRFYAYAAARLSAFPNIMWDIANEYRLFRDEAWVREMAPFLQSVDPNRHPVSVHGHGDFRFHADVWPDFALFQSWDEWGGYAFMRKNRELQAATGRIMPQVNEEYGYEDHYPQGWGDNRVAPARDAESRRRLAWEIYMAGGYQTTGERAVGADGEQFGGWVNGNGSDNSTEMLTGYNYIRRFFEEFEWWQTNPDDSVVHPDNKGWCLSEPGKQYAVYFADMTENGTAPREPGAIRLMLAAGRYEARWYYPPTGAFAAPFSVTAEAAVWSALPSTPFTRNGVDGALLLTRS